MPEYLSKEEVKQWRSSLEKITLEEYAARLGKVIEEEKQTNDLVDIVLKGSPVMSRETNSSLSRGEKISAIAQKSFDREREIAHASSTSSTAKKPLIQSKSTVKTEKQVSRQESETSLREEVQLVFAKALTDREQLVFDHFAKNKNQIVYAKDLATLLDLPRDYVYKYIKNLRAKIQGDRLQNADNGGYVLNI